MQSPQLLTPGPVPVPDFVQKAMSRPIIHHRTPTFQAMYGAILEDLRYLFQTTDAAVCTVPASGSGGVEMALRSLFVEKEKVVTVANGKFSQRWHDYMEQLDCEAIAVQAPWGQAPSVSDIVAACAGAQGLVLTHCETSTATILDLEEIAWAVRQDFPDICIVVDAITTVGTVPFYMDAWDIDCAIVASQKALMMPAGLCALALRGRARARVEAHFTGDAFHLYPYLQQAQQNAYPFTPPLLHLYALEAVLAYIRRVGLPAIWQASHAAAHYFRQEILARGATWMSQQPSDSLTAFSLKNDTATQALRQHWSQAGFEVSGGQGPWAGKVLRVSHMGMAQRDVMEVLLQAWES